MEICEGEYQMTLMFQKIQSSSTDFTPLEMSRS